MSSKNTEDEDKSNRSNQCENLTDTSNGNIEKENIKHQDKSDVEAINKVATTSSASLEDSELSDELLIDEKFVREDEKRVMRFVIIK